MLLSRYRKSTDGVLVQIHQVLSQLRKVAWQRQPLGTAQRPGEPCVSMLPEQATCMRPEHWLKVNVRGARLLLRYYCVWDNRSALYGL